MTWKNYAYYIFILGQYFIVSLSGASVGKQVYMPPGGESWSWQMWANTKCIAIKWCPTPMGVLLHCSVFIILII